ncbi:MAG: hypothetical protein HYZ57_13790 [Acidobacteria bacterium]|nr:hypothetical protein [Acidobacteriota bacterium]
MIEVHAELASGETTVTARAGKVTAKELMDVVNSTSDGSHSFRATLKRGPERKRRQ